MALVLQDRVRVNSAGSGTGDIVLAGAYPGYRTFASCIPDGSLVYYCIHNTSVGYDTEWEVGYGTYVLSTDTLQRNTGNSATSGIFASSNADAYVNFTSGANGLEVFITQPAEKAIYEEVNGETLIDGGPITIVGSGVTVIPELPAELGKFVGNVDSFAQIYNLNQSDGTSASADFVAYNDLTTDGYNYFVDMGINSSNYTTVDYPLFTPNSAYLFNDGGTLFIGSQSHDVSIFAGGVNTADIVMTANATSKSATFANSIVATANVSANNINVTNFAYSGANIAAAANGTVLVTKAYVDNATATGIHIHEPVRVERGSNLNATYNNGTDGVGATLTNAGTQEALVIDGISVIVADRVLVYGQTSAAQNGVYVVTTVGDGSTNWVLTRSSDADTYDTQDPNALGGGDYFYVTSGNTGAGESYVCTNDGVITFGTTPITFSQFSASPTYTGTAPINVSGQTIALTGIVNEAHGGTNASTYTTGDIIYANATNTLAKLSVGSAYKSLVVNAGGTAPEWNAVALNQSGAVSGALPATNGGTGQSTYALGDIIYSSAANTLAKLAGQTTTTQKFLSQTGNGTNSAAPVWDTIPAASITGLGTMSTQNANAVAITGGAINGTIIGNATPTTATFTTANATTFNGSGAGLTTLNGSNVSSGTVANARTTATELNTASAIVARDAGGNFTATTITANLTGTASTATTATTATTANNIAGGAAGGIPYQTGSGATSILATGTGVLVGGTTPSYSAAPVLTGTNFTSIPNGATTATAANTASAIVARDASGNFTAGTITANLTGTASSATSATNATNTAITNDTTTAAVMYPTWVTTTTGNLPQKVSSTKLTFTPSTGTLASTVFSGSGASLTSIPNGALVNSSTTINGTAIALGASGTITANTTQTLTRGTYLTGSNFNGSTATTWAVDATTTNTASKVVARDASGNFSAGTITANLTGTASSATTATTATNATNVGITNDTTTNATMYPVWVTTTTGNLPAKISSTKMTFNPSTGTLSATVLTASSDERLKQNWGTLGSDFVSKLAEVKSGTFERIDSGNREAGVTAQSLQKVLPETVTADEKGYLSVNYGGAALVAAIELAKVVEELRAEVKELKAKLANGA